MKKILIICAIILAGCAPQSQVDYYTVPAEDAAPIINVVEEAKPETPYMIERKKCNFHVLYDEDGDPVYYSNEFKKTSEEQVTGVVCGRRQRQVSQYKDGVPHGVVKWYYEDGSLEEETQYANGKRHGTKREYYESGALQVKANYKDDVPYGEFIQYYESGEIKIIASAALPDAEGVAATARGYSRDGELLDETQHNEKGKMHGLQKKYYPNGRLMQESRFVNGVAEGMLRTYYPSGKLESERMYVNNTREGLQRGYYESGKLSIEGYMKGGKQEGILKVYRENGQIFAEIPHENDMKHGEERQYWDKKIYKTVVYEKGVAVSGACYTESGKRTSFTSGEIHNLNNGFDVECP